MTTHLNQAAGVIFRYLVEEVTSSTSNETDPYGNSTDPYHNSTEDSHGEDAHSDDEHFGVHIAYEDLYNAFIFLTTIYVAGKIASSLLKMPDLVGEIVAGILLGPELSEFVPNPEAWVLFGEMGYVNM